MATTRRRFLSLLLLAVRRPKPKPAAITPAYLRGVRAAEADIRDWRPALTFNRLYSPLRMSDDMKGCTTTWNSSFG